jgi:hypothetical protein
MTSDEITNDDSEKPADAASIGTANGAIAAPISSNTRRWQLMVVQ